MIVDKATRRYIEIPYDWDLSETPKSSDHAAEAAT
jgi:hypothetical protein